ncbi:MAG: hypothetical protein JWL81_2062 [Verrucomicrobiales bacterium]|nr:hypothetical protein [Verrucomicrobiales bacterium]
MGGLASGDGVAGCDAAGGQVAGCGPEGLKLVGRRGGGASNLVGGTDPESSEGGVRAGVGATGADEGALGKCAGIFNEITGSGGAVTVGEGGRTGASAFEVAEG